MSKSTRLAALIRQRTKADLEWMASHFCKHGHAYLEHINCFHRDEAQGKLPQDCPIAEKLGFFDIEASNLSADFGYIFSYAIKERDGGIIGRRLRSSEIKEFAFDKFLLAEMCNDLRKFDRVCVHWGTDRRFDLPFARARALKHKLDFPLYKEIYATDTFTMAKQKLRLSRNRLENICDFFDIPSKGHKLNPYIWQRALAGDKESLEYIWTHNVEDVVSLEEVWKRLNLYSFKGKRSI